MSDRWIVAYAMAICVGALCPRGWSWFVLCIVLAVALIWAKPIGWLVALLMSASALSYGGWEALDRPFPAEESGTATLVKDPRSEYGTIRVEAQLHDRRVQLRAGREHIAVFRRLLTGDKLLIEGSTRPLEGLAAPSLRRKHVAYLVEVDRAEFVGHADAPMSWANSVRTHIESGAESLSPTTKTLLTGLVYGDDRAQSQETEHAFQEAGLTHLLAVSGQNVAFVLLIFAPLIGHFGIRGRLLMGLVVLGFFGIITRWEPSVIRAEMMAAVVLLANCFGMRASKWRVLALAVGISVLADPFLVGSIGFLLSVGACVGMAGLGEWLTSHLPGPLWLSRCVAYCLAAQIGTAPVQLAVFGDIPVVSLVANMLVEPIAGAAMMWGATAGLLAGLIGHPFDVMLHVPTRLLIGWIDLVARTTSSWGWGYWTSGRLWLAMCSLATWMWWRCRP